MSWIQTAKVGDKVVFIDTGLVTIANKVDGLSEPNTGDVCTISGFYSYRGEPFLYLEEHGGNQVFHYEAFRPVQRRDTSIEVFTRILHTAPAELEEA